MRLMWTDSERDSLLKTIASLDEAADANPYSRWVYGVVFPALALLGGIWTLIRSAPAWRFGVLIVALALLGHFHWFWSPSEKWYAVGYLGKVAALVVVVGVIFSFLWWFFLIS